MARSVLVAVRDSVALGLEFDQGFTQPCGKSFNRSLKNANQVAHAESKYC